MENIQGLSGPTNIKEASAPSVQLIINTPNQKTIQPKPTKHLYLSSIDLSIHNHLFPLQQFDPLYKAHLSPYPTSPTIDQDALHIRRPPLRRHLLAWCDCPSPTGRQLYPSRKALRPRLVRCACHAISEKRGPLQIRQRQQRVSPRRGPQGRIAR